MEDKIIQRWKKKFGRVYLVTIEGETKEEQPLEFLFRAPDRKVLSAAGRFAMSDPVKGTEIMLENCLIEGDVKALEDVGVFSAVAEKFEEINQPRVAALKKF